MATEKSKINCVTQK